MTSSNVLIVLLFLSSIFCQSVYSDAPAPTSLIDATTTPATTQKNLLSNSTTTTTTTTTAGSTTVNTTTTTTSLITNATTTTDENNSTSVAPTGNSTTSGFDNTPPSKQVARPGWWLLVALIVTVIVVIGIGVIYYQRQHNPYRRWTSWWNLFKFRFLRNWRSRDDEADNIILQLEQPDYMNGQWPPRISFT